MQLELADYVSIAEIISALAVVGSLIFVGVQLRENTRATKSASASATIATTSAWYVALGTNNAASGLFWHYFVDPKALSKEDQFQCVMLLHGLFLGFQNSFYLSRQGTLDEEIRQSLTTSIIGVKDTPGWRHFWSLRKSIFFPEFQQYIDNILASDEVVSEGLYADVGKSSESR